MSEKVEQATLFEEEATKGPVTCLGLTFNNDDERREHFREELRKKLPELKKLEGFPIGSDEDIIGLSDPPFYTVCPNPWLNEIIREWNFKSENITTDEKYKVEPFASDVSEGKNDPIYMAHSYHTKVPHKAVMRYILHYTKPNDIILDGFSGTGMTGVAANHCGKKEEISSLGFQVLNDGTIQDMEGNKVSKVGERNVILNDLAPAATFITNCFNAGFDFSKLHGKLLSIISEVEEEYGWLFETNHTLNNKLLDKKNTKGKINYIVWSDVFSCPTCSSELKYWDIAVDLENKKVKSEFLCPNCNSQLSKRSLQRKFNTFYDVDLGYTINQAEIVPVLINYSVGTSRFEKIPDKQDMELLEKVRDMKIDSFIPIEKLPEGYNTEQPINSHGFTHIHHLMSRRNNIIISKVIEKIKKTIGINEALFFITASIPNLTWMYRWRASGKGGIMTGTYYICSTPQENNAFNQLKRKLADISNVNFKKTNRAISTQSSTSLTNIDENSIDYIFTDPPFGANIMYSELNFYWEAWLRVFSNNNSEAIINTVQRKALPDYQRLMEECFSQFYRLLKPGRWMTVEFSNSQSSVWNAIREAIERVGFVIANVSALDKKQGSFMAVTSTTAVKQDLVITAYKPTNESIKKIKEVINTEDSAWEFINQHLEKLPVFLGGKGKTAIITERTPRILFDRMIAYHVQNGLPVPISSAEFQSKISQRFPMRDGMVFLESQVAEYDKKRTLVKEFSQLSLFVSDENSAIEWIRQQLMNKPQTRQDLHPNFMREIQHIAKHELLPELDDLLEQNFLMYDGNEDVPSQIHGYLSSNYKDLRNLEKSDSRLKEKGKNRWYVPDPNKQADLEKLREKSLLREFESYKTEIEGNKKKLKQFRTEAIRTGFKKAWSEKDFETIVKVGERLPEKVIQEDDKLLMYFDQAQIRIGM
ncbi:DNA methyltransferase [Salirhabdus sp. Marseille-P4669]|uniref:DNA methyltransferase n=1 Tax=Salirhabdus sp. Marseille-P4669 TaxID=2042310 RepID=UPI000C7AA7B2|nr:DNA methyltransferase [Salirhabdus sp. Marseille-P4669]